MEAITLDNGALRFTLKDENGVETAHTIDAYLLALTCEETVDEHKLAIVGGQYKTTSAFIRDLADRLVELGVPGCTPTVAVALWNRSGQEIERLKKNTSTTQTSVSGTDQTPTAETPKSESAC